MLLCRTTACLCNPKNTVTKRAAQDFIYLFCQTLFLLGSYKTRNGTEPEVIGAQYGRGHWTRGQKLALIRTVCLSVRTLISRSVAATKTGQAQAESHVKRMNC